MAASEEKPAHDTANDHALNRSEAAERVRDLIIKPFQDVGDSLSDFIDEHITELDEVWKAARDTEDSERMEAVTAAKRARALLLSQAERDANVAELEVAVETAQRFGLDESPFIEALADARLAAEVVADVATPPTPPAAIPLILPPPAPAPAPSQV